LRSGYEIYFGEEKERKNMDYTIKNEALTVVISDEGAQLQSIKSADGTEYLWYGNPTYWKGKAPNIFPYVARLTDGKYTLNGKEYEMKIHGILKYVTLEAESLQEDCITFRLDGSEEIRKQYPYDFTYRITYKLEGNKLVTINSVQNHGDERMFFAVGGHPGFNVPLEEGLAFEDYYLEFDQPARPYRVGFTDTCFLTGHDELYPLVDDKRILLHHDLFDQDAIVLKHACRKVRIASDKGTKSVTVTYPDFQYIGFWHMPKTDAPYVCVEPWSSLPSRDGIVEEFSQQSDLIGLAAGDEYKNTWTIEFE
jgi:galactose mutarotase-like enzyme